MQVCKLFFIQGDGIWKRKKKIKGGLGGGKMSWVWWFWNSYTVREQGRCMYL